MPRDSLPHTEIDDSQPDLDDFADCPAWRFTVPARRFDIDDVQKPLDTVHGAEGKAHRGVCTVNGSVPFLISEQE
jgi:hypothetical protein